MLRVPAYTFQMVALLAALSVADPARSQCPVNWIDNGCSGTVPSAAPSASASCGQLSVGQGTVSYDVPNGTLGAYTTAWRGIDCENGGGGGWGVIATTIDDYAVLGGLPVGTPITIRARLSVRVNGTDCGSWSDRISEGWGTIQEGATNSATGGGCGFPPAEWPVEIVINSFIGTPIRISCSLSGASGNACSSPQEVSGYADAVLTFLELPPGCWITSCQGFSQPAVSAVADGGQTLLDLEPLGANPSSGTFALAVTLPDDSPARVALYNVGGRLVTSVDLGGAGAGRHTVRLGADKVLATGVYYVRLTQGARSVQRKQLFFR